MKNWVDFGGRGKLELISYRTNPRFNQEGAKESREKLQISPQYQRHLSIRMKSEGTTKQCMGLPKLLYRSHLTRIKRKNQLWRSISIQGLKRGQLQTRVIVRIKPTLGHGMGRDRSNPV